MRMLILEEKEQLDSDILDNLYAIGKPLKISENCNSLTDCIKWLEDNFSAPAQPDAARTARQKSRIVVKRGMEYQTLKVEDIAYFFTENKVAFVVDRENRKYLAEKSTLGELEADLDKNTFYRVNRKYIVNADYIKSFKPMARSKIRLEISPAPGEELIISQENSAAFRKWIGES